VDAGREGGSGVPSGRQSPQEGGAAIDRATVLTTGIRDLAETLARPLFTPDWRSTFCV